MNTPTTESIELPALQPHARNFHRRNSSFVAPTQNDPNQNQLIFGHKSLSRRRLSDLPNLYYANATDSSATKNAENGHQDFIAETILPEEFKNKVTLPSINQATNEPTGTRGRRREKFELDKRRVHLCDFPGKIN